MPAAGMGASGPDKAMAIPMALRANLPSPEGTPPVATDSVAALLAELSQSDLTAVLRIVENFPPSVDGAGVAELLRAAGDAAAGGDIHRLLVLVRQVANLDPARAEALASESAFTPYRTQVEQLLAQLTAAAKLHAEGRLASAVQIVDTGAVRDKSGDVRLEVFLLLATKFMDAGGLANYVRSAALSSALVEQFQWLPTRPEALAIMRPPGGSGAGARWLIAVWIAIGIVAVALCWWLRADYLPLVCIAWVAVLVLLIVGRRAADLR